MDVRAVEKVAVDVTGAIVAGQRQARPAMRHVGDPTREIIVVSKALPQIDMVASFVVSPYGLEVALAVARLLYPARLRIGHVLLLLAKPLKVLLAVGSAAQHCFGSNLRAFPLQAIPVRSSGYARIGQRPYSSRLSTRDIQNASIVTPLFPRVTTLTTPLTPERVTSHDVTHAPSAASPRPRTLVSSGIAPSGRPLGTGRVRRSEMARNGSKWLTLER